jgi:hypothetical protein
MSYAQIETKKTYLSSDFGESYARKIFGDDLINQLPRITRGERKGKLKGYIVWDKVISGGITSKKYVRNGGYSHEPENYLEIRKNSVIYVAIWLPEYERNYHKYANGVKPDTLLLEKHLNLYNDFYKSLWNADHEDLMNVHRLQEYNNIKEIA